MTQCLTVFALLASASAFSPAAAMRPAVSSVSAEGRFDRVVTPVAMAGWKDPYMDKYKGPTKARRPLL